MCRNRESSCRFQVIVPEVDMDAVARGCVGPPQFAQREADVVAVLWIFTNPHCVGVGENERAVVSFDHAAPAARVSWQPGMPGWIQVARNDPIAAFEARRRAIGAARACAMLENPSNI